MKSDVKNKITIFALALCVVFEGVILFFNNSSAQVAVSGARPAANQIDVSAFIVGMDDKEITNGEYDVQFSLYTIDRKNETDPQGTSVWNETQKVHIINGALKTYLGLTAPLPANINFTNGIYYLGMKIGTDTEMIPRKRIGAVPLALNAFTSQSVGGATIGTVQGNIPVLGAGGKFPASMMPSITKLGTVTTGVWEADVIESAYIVEALEDKTYNGLTLTALANGFSIANGTVGILTITGTVGINQSLLTTSSPTFATLNLTTLDLGTNTITDGAMTGNWNFGAGNLTTTGTLTVGALGSNGDLDMNSHIIANIGNAGTDFTATGGLTLADTLTISGLSGVLKATAGVVSGGATTTDLPEGISLYYLDSRARASISETITGLSYDNITGILSLTGAYVIPTTTEETNWNTAYSNRVDTWNAPLSFLANAASLNYSATNLKLTLGALDTIQDIATTSSPTFATLNLTTLDLGTNTITDGNFNGNWSFNSGNLSGIGTIDTGQGAYELYAMDQNVTTLSAPQFAGLTLTGNLVLGANTLTTTNATLIANLNADLLDGQHGAYYLTAANIAGTDNYIPRFNGANALENSLIYDTGTYVGIGLTNPTYNLQVSGTLGIGSTAYFASFVGIGTTSPSSPLSIGASAASGTLFDIFYTQSAVLDGSLIGARIDLNDGHVVPTNQSVTGLRVVLPTTTNTNGVGTVSMDGMSLGYGVGTGINQNGAGATVYSGVNLLLPALTQTSGTLTANGVLITTSSSITTGGTANGISIAATGVGAGSLNGLRISNIVGSGGTEAAVNIGSGWDSILSVNGIQIINGLGVVQVAGGGTGLTTYATGDLIYASAADTLSNLVAGTGNNGKVLVVSGGVPTWGVVAGSSCTDCVLNDPTSVSTQTITPNNQDISSLVVRQTTFAVPTEDIFKVTNANGSVKYFYVDKDGNVSTGGVSSQSITLTPASDIAALTLIGTNVPTANLEYINSKNTQGTIFNIAYGVAETLAGTLIGEKIDLGTNVTADGQSVAGLSLILPGVNNTNSTSTYKGLIVALPGGSGINQNGAGSTTFSGMDVTIPPLTQTSGTLTGNGVLVNTPSSITTGGTANGINIAATGVGAGILNGINVSDITPGAGRETGLYIGTGWDYSALFMGGNVGIGTTAPGYKLDVQGGYANASSGLCINGDCKTSWTGAGIGSWSTNGTHIYNNNAGNVGIGTTNPGQKLEVAGAGYFSSGIYAGTNNSNYLIDDAANGAGSSALYIGNRSIATVGSGGSIYGTSNYVAKFTADNVLGNSLIYDNGTSVGIGTTSPLNKLHIAGTGGGSAGIYLNDAAPSSTTYTLYNSGGALYWEGGQISAFSVGSTGQTLYNNAGVWTATSNLYHDGTNVGIGNTDPQYKLHVEGQCVTGDSLLPIFESEEEFSIFNFQFSKNDSILNDQIKYKRIDEIKGGEYVMSLDEKTGKLVPAKIKGLLDMGVKPIYEMETEDGKKIRTTGNHPYLTKKGWTKVASLEEGEEIAVANEILPRLSGRSQEQNNGADSHQNKNSNLEFGVKIHGDNDNKLFSPSGYVGNNGSDYSQYASEKVEDEDTGCGTQSVIHDFSRVNNKLSDQNIRENKSPENGVSQEEFLSKKGARNIAAKNTMPISPNISERRSSLDEEKNICESLDVSTNNYSRNCQEESNDEDIKFVRIARITLLPPEQVYDIEVENTHNFVANGIIAHNTYINGAVTSGLINGQTISSTANFTGSVAITGAITGATSYNGLIITANTGDITTGTWNGTSIADGKIDNNLTIAGGTISGASNTMSLGSDATGDIYYRDASGYLTRLPIGTSSQVLHGGTIPGYGAIVAGDITADSLDFTEFKDLMALDAATDVALAGNNFTFSGTGNVGIGTTSPGAKLTLQNGTDSVGIRLNGRSSDGDAVVGFYQNDGTTPNAVIDGLNTELRNYAYNNSPITFYTGGSEHVRINSSGNVGIGAAAPLDILHLKGSGKFFSITDTSDTTSGIRFRASDDSYRMRIEFTGINAATERLGIWGNSGGSPTDTEKVSILSSGNVGIGTTVPGYLLHVNGTLGVEGVTTHIGAVNLSSTLTATVSQNSSYISSFQNQNTGTAAVTELKIGNANGLNVGRLRALGSSFTTSNYDQQDSFVIESGRQALNLVASNNKDINFWNGTSQSMVVQTDGNVGIGTTGPGAELELSKANARFNMVSTTGTNNSRIKISNTAGDLWFGRESSAGGTLLVGSTAYSSVINSQGAYSLHLSANDNLAMTINSGGNVGIGTTAPEQALDVVGKIKASSNLILGGMEITPTGIVYGADWRLRGAATGVGNIGSYEGEVNFGASINSGGNYNVNITPSGTVHTIISGNVGIGTTNPLYKLDVLVSGTGPIARFNNTSNNTGCAFGATGIMTCTSDARLKKNIADSGYGLDSVMALRPVEYNWKNENNSTQKTIGFIAQDVEGVMPQLVITDASGYKELNTIGMVPVLVKAIQEQEGQITNLQSMQTQNFASLQTQLNDSALSMNDKITLIGQNIDAHTSDIAGLRNDLDSLKSGQISHNSAIKQLQDQMELIQEQNKAVIDLALALDTKNWVLKDAEGNVNILGGKLEADGVVAGAFSVRVADSDVATMGEAAMRIFTDDNLDGIDDNYPGNDGKFVVIKTTAVSSSSKVYITPIGSTKNQVLYVGKIIPGASFEVKVDDPVKEDIKFNWWIVEQK